MKGGIYSDEKCPVCGSRLYDNGKNALICLKHPKQKATRFKVHFEGIYRRFKNYDQADRFLTGLRYKTDEGTFDRRDYQKDNPLGFSNLIERYVDRKKADLKPRNHQNLINYSTKASLFFSQKNVKEIGYPELEDFKHSLKVSEKTRKNYMDSLRAFFVWMKKSRYIKEVPEFPIHQVELGYRKTTDKVTQQAIIDKVKEITYNPKIWLAIKLLATYISIRPGELITLEEGNIDLGNGYLYFPHPKEKKFKSVPLIPEDVELFREYPPGIPSIRFFRHIKGSGYKEGTPFGHRVLRTWWYRACSHLGISGVDLYGGTKHSSARALRAIGRTPEEIKRATGHATNKAFERYFQIEADDMRSIYQDASDKVLTKKNGHFEKSKLLNFNK